MHWNSVLSTPGAKYCTGNISNMYLMSLLPDPEFVRFRYDLIPPQIRDHYNLDSLVVHGYVYTRINRAWYGLSQSGKIAHDDLVEHLGKYGYIPAGLIDGLFVHKTRDISFTLVVDDFGIKYQRKEDVEHLIKAMREKYTFKVDYDAKQYIGVHLDWVYTRREVKCSMKGYVKQALTELEHELTSNRHQGAPSQIVRPEYGAKIQYVKEDASTPINNKRIKRIQRIIGKFLYYARAIDNTILHALNDIATMVSKAITNTEKAVQHFMNYAACNPKAEVIFRASDMILQTDLDAAYLVAKNARSQAGGYHYLTSKDHTMFNGAFYMLASVIKNVMASAMEAKIAALYLNATLIIEYRRTLQEMGHPQPPTVIQTDNKTAHSILTGTMKQKRSKSIDMRFHWLKD